MLQHNKTQALPPWSDATAPASVFWPVRILPSPAPRQKPPIIHKAATGGRAWRAGRRSIPPRFPLGTLIDARFRYEENGRLTIVVTVGEDGTKLRHEITCDNTLTQEQLDSWREYIEGTASA